MVKRTPTDGLPYYCKACGCGLAEYLACENTGCELESTEQARERIPHDPR